jgi:hypothetical protein
LPFTLPIRPPCVTEVVDAIEQFAHQNPRVVAAVAAPLVASAAPAAIIAAPALLLGAPPVAATVIAANVGPTLLCLTNARLRIAICTCGQDRQPKEDRLNKAKLKLKSHNRNQSLHLPAAAL